MVLTKRGLNAITLLMYLSNACLERWKTHRKNGEERVEKFNQR